MAKHGKHYQDATKLMERTREYNPQEAIALAKQVAYANFDETVELHLHMGSRPPPCRPAGERGRQPPSWYWASRSEYWCSPRERG